MCVDRTLAAQEGGATSPWGIGGGCIKNVAFALGHERYAKVKKV